MILSSGRHSHKWPSNFSRIARVRRLRRLPPHVERQCSSIPFGCDGLPNITDPRLPSFLCPHTVQDYRVGQDERSDVLAERHAYPRCYIWQFLWQNRPEARGYLG